MCKYTNNWLLALIVIIERRHAISSDYVRLGRIELERKRVAVNYPLARN